MSQDFFVRVYNAAESRYYPVSNTRDIDEILSNPNGHFQVEENNGEPVIYTALQVKAACNDKARQFASSKVNADSSILAKIAAAAQKAAMTPAAEVANSKATYTTGAVVPEVKPIPGNTAAKK